MHDLAFVGVGESVEHPDEEAHPVFDLEPMRRAGQALPVDEFERQEPVPFGRSSAVEEAGDAGMFERGENANLVAKAADRLASQAGRVEELERHTPAEALGRLFGEEDAPHATAADFAQQPERADLRRERPGHFLLGELLTESFDCGTIERDGGAPGRGQQLPEILDEAGVVAGETRQAPLALGFVQLDEVGEELRQAGVGAHLTGLTRASSRTIQARPNAQSRLTVRSEISSSGAISWSSSPPK